MAILVVENDGAIREVLLAVLEDEGYAAIGAADGQAALDYLHSASEPPCLILLDLMMPRLDGWAFRAAQQHDQRIATVPVVVLSARPDGLEQVAALGDVAFLSKPINMSSMLSLVQTHCAP